MEIVACKRVLLPFLLCSLLLFSGASSDDSMNAGFKVRGVNLGGWLIIEGWMKPSLFDGIPHKDMLDGTEVQFKSVILKTYLSADNEGGLRITVDRDVPSSWETFRLRTHGDQFLSCDGNGSSVKTTAKLPSARETFSIERNSSNSTTRVHIKLSSGEYLQGSSQKELRADYAGKPRWDDNAATFEMTIVSNNFRGDYQLIKGYGNEKAKEVLTEHRNSFITAEDFQFLSDQGINTVRIPVGWWTAFDNRPPVPYIGGSLEYLDKAFSWAKANNIKCIVDLHAAPGSQNGKEHSASRDGSLDWTESENIEQSLQAIDFFSSRYANDTALLGIQLLNQPLAPDVALDILVSYYKDGYNIVRKYSSTAYVIVSQRLGSADQHELFHANIGTSNLVVDFHFYSVHNDSFNNMTVEDNIQFIYKTRGAQIQALNDANGPLVFIGEWVNAWRLDNASQVDYQNFGKAQLEVYGTASFGWAYWTLKNNITHWDFEWNIKNKYLKLLGNKKEQVCTCGLDNLVIQFDD